LDDVVPTGPIPGFPPGSWSGTASGWALDWDSDPAIHSPVTLWVAKIAHGEVRWEGPFDNPGQDYFSTSRLDVQAAYGRGGTNGFAVGFGYKSTDYEPGEPVTVCVVALNTVGPGDTTVVGCKSVVLAGTT